MKLQKLAALLSVGTLLVAVTALTAEEASPEVDLTKIKCVVSGKTINPEATADYRDATVYFCCPGCPGAFAKNTAKYAAQANHQLVATQQAEQIGCPMSGKECDPETAIEVAGAEITFCCSNCQGAAEGKEEVADQIQLIFNDKAFKKAFKIVKK